MRGNSVFQHDFMKVEQEAQWCVQQFHITEELRLVTWQEFFNDFELQDQNIDNVVTSFFCSD